MKKTIIPETDIRVSRIGFGTASLHHLFRTSSRLDLLRSAADAGITHFDTSPYYGYGLAEADLGRFLHGRRGAFTLATKIGLYPWGYSNSRITGVWTRKAIGKLVPRVSLPIVRWQVGRARISLESSLRRLGTDYTDFLFLHEPDPALLITDEMLGWLQLESAAGRVRSWGVAGVSCNVAPFVVAHSPLANVVQTKDSNGGKEADFMSFNGRALQFTYGYLSAFRSGIEPCDHKGALLCALRRNQTGAILVSTRCSDRILTIAKVLE